LKILHIWLKTTIPAPEIYVFGGFLPPNIILCYRDPQKALTYAHFEPLSVAIGPAMYGVSVGYQPDCEAVTPGWPGNHLGGPHSLLPHGHSVLGQRLREAVSNTAATPW